MKTIRLLKFFVLFSLLYFLGPGLAAAASLYSSPAVGNISLGQTITIGIYVSSPHQAMNAISGSLNFPADKLEVLSVSKSGSIVNLWVQEPSFSNSSGMLNFEGIVLNPGFTGSGGKVISIQFRAKNIGTSLISFSSASILANDGNGTNILSGLTGSSLSVQQQGNTVPGTDPIGVDPLTPQSPIIISQTHPDQEKWYSLSDVNFSWQSEPGVTGVRTLFDKLARSQPTIINDSLTSVKSVKGITDGIWFFHLQLKNKYGWGGASHFRVQIDKTEPEPFSINFLGDKNSVKSQPKIKFETEDKLSGIDYYLVKINDPVAVKVYPEEVGGREYSLSVNEPGRGLVIIEAYDKAGNSRIETEDFFVESLEPPVFEEYPKELTAGKILVVKGKSYPDSEVIFKVLKDDKEMPVRSIHAGPDGSFVFVYEDKVAAGVYKVSARTVADDSGQSFFNEPILIPVSQGFLQLSGFTFLSAIGFMALVVAISFLLFHIWQHIKRRSYLTKEISEAKTVLLEEFKKLKREAQKQVDLLENLRQWRELSFEEAALLEDLGKEIETLSSAENLIKKEIEDINQV